MMIRNTPKVAAVLAGGRSSRFGSDKTYAPWRGKTFLEHACISLEKLDFRVYVSLSEPKPLPVSNEVVLDIDFLGGPLQALYSLVCKIRAERILITAVDMPLVKPDILEFLWKEGEAGDVVTLSDKNVFHPMPGVYSFRLKSIIRSLLDNNVSDMHSLLNRPDVRHVSLAESRWRAEDPKGESLHNVNRTGDLD